MAYKFWQNGQGRTPVLEELEEISLKDANSGKAYWKHLHKLEKYSFQQLLRVKLIKKLKGKNPYKIFELRFQLPQKVARTFFVVGADATIWLLHLIIKKSDSTPPDAIATAEARANLLNNEIKYL
jgi:phage-related protein